MSRKNQFCTFHLASYLFGIEVLRVQEVLRQQEMTPVPLAPQEVRGLINLRGQIVPAVDMRRRLGLKDSELAGPPMNVVIRASDGQPVSLLVDEIGDVLDVDEADFEPPPETLRGATRELIKGAYKLPGKLMLVLDSEQAMDVASAGVKE